MWGKKLSNPAPLFSNYDYFRNYHFQRCLRNWNKYIEYDGKDVDNEELMYEWEELLLKDFYKSAKEWFDRVGDEIFWRVGLE